MVCFYNAKGEIKDKDYIKHSKIIYDTNEQVNIIKKKSTI